MSLLSLSKKIISRGKKGTDSATKTASDDKNKKNITAKPVVIPKIEAHMLLSEKSTASQEQNTIFLRVSPTATKYQITQAVKDKYGVTALRVRTAQFSGKIRRRGRTEGSTNAWKKAYVKVDNIQSLTIGP